MRQYEKTHPWITFQIDLREMPYSLWMKLGECTSKIEHISRVPLVHDSAEDLYKVYLAKGVHATTAIEGNSYVANKETMLNLRPFRAPSSGR